MHSSLVPALCLAFISLLFSKKDWFLGREFSVQESMLVGYILDISKLPYPEGGRGPIFDSLPSLFLP